MVASPPFSHLGLAEPILRALKSENYLIPTPIQEKAIPPIMERRDVLGCAQTGTGKTAAFALPILHRLAASTPPGPRKIRALVLSPTRELTSQIGESFSTYGKNLDLRGMVIFGGVSQNRQEQVLRGGIDLLIATPGRLLDLMNQGIVDLKHVEVFVLDEADNMLDMGFIVDIRKIMTKLPAKRQNLMFSATMPKEILQLANTILKDPITVSVTPVSSAVETVEQSVYFLEKRNKPVLLTHFIMNNGVSRALVFTRTKHGADKVTRFLEKQGIRAVAIHGNKNQNARTRAIASFKSKSPPVLVATDIAARGLDIDNVSHVVNFDVPNVPETYVHRIGRTGRAGATGMAVSFCDPEERGWLRAIERLTKIPIPVKTDHPEYPAGERLGHQQSEGSRDDRDSRGGRDSRDGRDSRSSGPRRSDRDHHDARASHPAPSRHPHPRPEHQKAQPAHSKPQHGHAAAHKPHVAAHKPPTAGSTAARHSTGHQSSAPRPAHLSPGTGAGSGHRFQGTKRPQRPGRHPMSRGGR
jgi:ATP-dependent RNA helicase RhlE